MTTDEIIKLFASQGFPAAVAVYVLWRLDARLRDIQEALSKLAVTIARFTRSNKRRR